MEYKFMEEKNKDFRTRQICWHETDKHDREISDTMRNFDQKLR